MPRFDLWYIVSRRDEPSPSLMNKLHVIGRYSTVGVMSASCHPSVVIVLKLEAVLPLIVVQPEPLEKLDDVTSKLDFDRRQTREGAMANNEMLVANHQGEREASKGLRAEEGGDTVRHDEDGKFESVRSDHSDINLEELL